MPSGFLPTQGIIQRSFGGGEIAPALHARADQVKYATGLRRCRNMIVQKAGGVTNRPGTRYVNTCKTASPSVELIPYQGDGITTTGMLLEVGVGYIRFYLNGGLVTLAGVAAWSNVVPYLIGDIVLRLGVNYYCIQAHTNQDPNATFGFWYAMPSNILELPHGFGATLPYWSQDGRTITLTAVLIRPQELINLGGPTSWAIQNIVTKPAIAPPTGLVLTPGAAGARRFAYVVTAAGADYEESEQSGQVINAACADPTPAAPHHLAWTLVAGVPEYYVYGDPYNNGTYGFLGTAKSNAFNDIGFVPDFTITPPLAVNRFVSTSDRPAVSTSYQQRRMFGYTSVNPTSIFGSRTGYPSNYGISSPLQDDDAIEFKLASRQAQNVRHLVGLKQLVVLTDNGGWRVGGDQAGALTPSSINADQELYTGAAVPPPVIIGNSIVYIQARGSILYDAQFEQAVEGLAGRDLTTFSSHLFESHTLRKIDYALAPNSVVWCVRDDGVLLGMTYLRDQDVWGWHRHDTSGFFWDVAVVQEADRDVVYFIVRRTINGSTVRYIEKLEKREIVATNFDVECFFVDAGLSYSGVPVGNVAGLGHLEGQRVAIVGDGAVISDGVTGTAYLVTAGTIAPALPALYSNIHVGIPYTPEIETLDLDVDGANARDKQKAVGPVQLLIDRSSRSFSAGPDTAHLTRYTAPDWEPAADEFSGQVEIATVKTFDKYGRVFVRQTDPLPITILGIIPDAELGG